MSDQPSVIASRYRVIRQVGRGAMGVVYEVQHAFTFKQHALKVLLAPSLANPEIVERFRREMRTPALIRSEHVVDVTDADVAPELGGAPFLVMELLDGCDLLKLLEGRGTLTAEEVVWLLGQAARGLDKAHAAGIVHRDLKPGNLFLQRREDGSRITKILDFGVAKLTEEAAFKLADGIETQTGEVLGTPQYMSWEQVQGKKEVPIGPPTDIWALGLMAFRLLTGKSYWRQANFPGLIKQIEEQPKGLPSLRAPEIPRSFDEWFLRSIHRDPAQRWGTAGEQVAALAEALGVSAQRAGDGPYPDPPAEQLLDARKTDVMHAVPFSGEPSASALSISTPMASFSIVEAMVMEGSAPPVPSQPRRPRLFTGRGAAAGLVILLASGYVTFLALSRNGRAPGEHHLAAPSPPVGVAEPVSPRPPRMARLALDSIPSGAEVLDAGGASLGKTPLVVEAARAAGNAMFTFKLSGYANQQIELATDHDGATTVRLTGRPPKRKPGKDGVVDPFQKHR